MIIEFSAWDKNKKFFGTSSQPDQISKIMDMLHEQESRITELEEQVAELELLVIYNHPEEAEEEEPEIKPKKK